MSSAKWRMFYVLFDLLGEKALFNKVAGEVTVFDRMC
jgi:hypothetical protein